MTDTEVKKSSGCKNTSLIFTVLLLIAVTCLCTICGGIAAWTDGFGLLDGDSNGDNISSTEYLGFEVEEIKINDYEEFNNEVFEFYNNLGRLAELETSLENAAEYSNSDKFFDTYKSYNQTAGTLIGEAQAMSDFMGENETTSSYFNLVQKVHAKERSSWWYYVPIIGSLVRAKHKSIETSRAGIYNYMKNELESVDRDEFLKYYNLDSVKDIRNASDEVVEKLARDPELRAGIDWTKVGTDLAEHACQAVSEGYKIGPSRTPDVTAGVGAGFRYILKWAKPVQDEMPANSVVLPLNQETRTAIDNAAGNSIGDDWNQLSADQQQSVTSAVRDAAKNDKIDVAKQLSFEDLENVYKLAVGTWDILITSKDLLPFELTDIDISDNKTTTATIQPVTISEYALDPEIAKTLGFNIEIDQEEFVVSACSDLGIVDSWYKTEADKCKRYYDTCLAEPYTIPQESSEAYVSCTGRDGGCWDIHRWSEIPGCSRCPIDNEGTLDYSHGKFQDDFDYFPAGNLAYCECCTNCWNEFSVERDCYSEFEGCCQQYFETE